MSTGPGSFSEFYRQYLTHHDHPVNRGLHVLGSLTAIGLLIAAFVLREWRLLLLMPVVGYGCAWLGHFAFERNKPTAFRSPWWSFLADWRMCVDVLRGRLPLVERRSEQSPD
jgi:hypothetical protein